MNSSPDTPPLSADGTGTSNLVRVLALAPALVGLVVLILWLLGRPELATFGLSGVLMAPNTAALFSLFGFALLLSIQRPDHLPFQRVTFWSFLIGGLAVVVLLVFSAYDIYLLSGHVVEPASGYIFGRMSPITAVAFLLVAVAFLATPSPLVSRLHNKTLALSSAALLLLLSLSLSLAYLFGVPVLYDTVFIPPAFLTCLAFLALSLGVGLRTLSPIGFLRSEADVQAHRLYLPAALVALFLLIVISITVWAGNTLTMITAIARFERTHTVSRVEAMVAFYDYQGDKKPEDLERFYQKMAITQSYNKVFSRLLDMRKDTPAAEFVRILESTFSETDHKTAVIIVNRIKVLYWHPILKALVADAVGAHAAGETLKLQVAQFLAAEGDEAKHHAILADIQKTRTEFIGYETSFSKSCSLLSRQISSYIIYVTIALLVLSVGFISLLTYRIAKNVIQQKVKDALALRLTRLSIENASDAMYWMTPEARIVDVNEAACRLLGYSRAELLRLTVPDVDAHYDAEKWPGHFAELRQLGSMTFESEQRHRDGRLIPVEIVANYVRFGEEERNCAFVRDITFRKQAEAKLRASEESLSLTLHSIGDAVIATDVAGLITRMNPTAERLTAWPLADALGQPLTEVFRIINAQTRVPSVDPVQAMLAHGEVVGLANHTVLLARDGQEYQIADSAAPIHDAAGKILGVVLVFSDVTEKYRLEETLARTTDLLNNATEIAKIGGWELELASMKLTWSLGTYRLHELDPLTPVDVASGIQFYAPEAQPVIAAAVQAAIDTGTPYDLDLPLLTAKGRAFWARAQCNPVTENGRVIKLVGAFQDITERKQAEALLREREAQVRTKLNAILSPEGDLDALELEDILDVSAVREMMENIFDLTGIAVALGDLNGKALVAFGWQDACTQYHRANPEACRNCTESDTVLVSHVEPGTFKLYKCKNNLWDLAVPIHVGERHLGNLFVGQLFFEDEVPDLAIFQAQAKRFGFNEAEYLAALGRVPRVSRETVNALAEFYTRFSAMISNLSYSSIQFARVHAQREQTEAEKVKLQTQLQQSQKMESLGTLAGGVAHDMNNVLGAILGLASAHIGTQPYGSPLHQALDTICKATERGGKMVKSLLSFARQSPAENSKLDMNAIVREQVALLERTTLAKVRLEIDLESALRPILGDASTLTHAFMNLCVNAVDAMPESGTLTLHTRNVDNDWIEVVVEDNGMGMPKEVLEKAMEPFFTTKETGKGTGLGLSMVFSTVKAHRGQMAIESEPGQGTRVMLRFPACEREAPVQAVVVEVAEATQIPHGTMKVLVIDDDDLIQSSVQAILEVLGYAAVNTAQSGEDALTMLEAGLEADLVILDMNMPGLGGIGTLPRLRVLRPEVPVLLATGRVDQTALSLASAHPGVTLLAKPFGLRELQKHLESIGLG